MKSFQVGWATTIHWYRVDTLVVTTHVELWDTSGPWRASGQAAARQARCGAFFLCKSCAFSRLIFWGDLCIVCLLFPL